MSEFEKNIENLLKEGGLEFVDAPPADMQEGSVEQTVQEPQNLESSFTNEAVPSQQEEVPVFNLDNEQGDKQPWQE